MEPRRIVALAITLSFAAADAKAEPVEYLRDVKPVLQARCFACHGALKQEGGLRVDTGAAIREGGDSGPAVIPGDVVGSLLIERISAVDVADRMPPEGEPLTPDEIVTITNWVTENATSPEDEQPEPDPRDHWSFRRPRRPAVPDVENPDWVRNPIDAFIAAERVRWGVTPLPEADPQVLLRRAHLDLVGLPPTREEFIAFTSAPSSEAYEQLVNDLLDRPQYGERWGRHWMDVWRYSDWYGRRNVNDVRNSYPHIWRWRDWIINSLNADKGYDEMVREMLAADELKPTDDEAVVATGFIVRNWFSLNYDQWMRDLVEHTGKAFLGLRMNCALCHDHKYDPITQEDYFQLRAFFEPLELRQDRVPGGPALPKLVRYTPGSGASLSPTEAGLVRIYEEYPDAETLMYQLGDQRDLFEDRGSMLPGMPDFLGGEEIDVEPLDLPPVAFYPGLKPFVQEAETEQRRAAVTTAETAVADARQALSDLEARQASARDEQAEAASNLAALLSEDTATEETPPLAARSVEDIGYWRFEGGDDENGFLADSSGHGHVLSRIDGTDPPAAPAALGEVVAGRFFPNPVPGTDAANVQAARFEQRQSFGYLAADDSSDFHANEFTIEACVHFETASPNFNRTIAQYTPCWTWLHRGLDESTFELRMLYENADGEQRDVSTSQADPPIILSTGVDYALVVTLDRDSLTFFAKRLDDDSPPLLTRFPRDADGVDFAELATPGDDALLKIGNSDGSGRVVGLIDEVRYARGAAPPEEALAAYLGTPADRARMRLGAVESVVRALEAERFGAEAAVSVADAALTHARAEVDSIEARTHADRVRYLGADGDPELTAQAASEAERIAAWRVAQQQLAVAEQTLTQARSNLPAGNETSDDLTAAETALAAAAETAEAARLKTEEVSSEYTQIGPTYRPTSTGRRTALANWIASDQNPLTARVAVNHIWMRHFGRPLVDSVFDFGRSGTTPTHPELLDWLAVELMANGWSMKHIHRLIVTSSTYRMRSSVDSTEHPNLIADPDNTSWWRFERKRMEAELLRDSLLYASGALDQTRGGHEIAVDQGPTVPRRSLYFALYPEAGGTETFLERFDPPDPSDCYRRTDSIMPQQALALANSRLTLNFGRPLAHTLWSDTAPSDNAGEREAEFIRRAFQQVLTRNPTEVEQAACADFLRKQQELFAGASQDELRGTPREGVASASLEPGPRSRESLIRVLFNHNDFATVH